VRRMVIELVPDFMVNPESTPANVVPIKRKRTSPPRI
jgi:hypothetical protein